MNRPDAVSPPPVEAFEAWRSPAGPRSARMDISGVTVEFEGLPDPLADQMAIAYGPYCSAPSGAGRPLRARVHLAPVEYFVPPGFAPAWGVYRMHTALEGGVFRAVSYRLASWIDLARREGEVISDDLTLVLRRSDGLVAAGGPFRGTYTRGTPVVGTFPVAGFYRLPLASRCCARRPPRRGRSEGTRAPRERYPGR